MIHLSCADSKEKQFVFEVGMKRKHSSFLGLNQKVVVASAYVLVQKFLVYVVWFNLRKTPQLRYGFIKVVWHYSQSLSEQLHGIAQTRVKQSFIFSRCTVKCTTQRRQTSC